MTRLLFIELHCEAGIELEEIDQFTCGIDGHLDLLLAGDMVMTDYGAVVMRHDTRTQFSGFDGASADYERDLDMPGLEFGQFQL